MRQAPTSISLNRLLVIHIFCVNLGYTIELIFNNAYYFVLDSVEVWSPQS